MKAGSKRYNNPHLLKRKLAFWGLLSLIILGLIIPLYAQSSLKEGQDWYTRRASQADSFRTSSDNIDKAIAALESTEQDGQHSLESALHLLQSYYFKGIYTDADGDKRKQAFDKARSLGEKMIDQHPKSAAAWFWHTKNLIEWDRMHNLWQTTIDRTDGKIRNGAQKVVALDSTYQDGGGYRLLAKVHYETPSIFLVKGWPSKDEALAFIQKALKITPANPASQLFYARILLHFGRNTEAKTQLEHVRDLNPRSDHLLEDRYLKHQADLLWNKHIEQQSSE